MPPRPSRSAFRRFTKGRVWVAIAFLFDPFYLSWLARKHGLTTRFIKVALEINTRMPEYLVHRLGEALNHVGKPIKGRKICILGMAYKKDVDDPRESPSFELLEMLVARGASVTYSDPHIPGCRGCGTTTYPRWKASRLHLSF
jgi:UDP-N-acetyl-D-mannosaminuronate dehydrogenase